VKVPDEDAVNAAALDAGPHQLYLRAFTAVEQKNVAITDERGA
jgi:hypothetical protein